MLGIILAATGVVLALRMMRLRTMLGLANYIDIGFFILLVWLFHGTLAGMTGAATGGLLLAVALSIGRLLIGYRAPRLRRGKVVWIERPSPIAMLVRRVFSGFATRWHDADTEWTATH